MFISDRTMKLLLESGLPADKLVEIMQALRADEESARPIRTASAERQARYRQRKASQSVTEHNGVTDGDAERNGPRPLPLSPQTPQTPTPTPGDINTRARGVAAKPNGFARFWEAYPHKVGKAAAERAYIRAIGKIGGHDPPAVLLAGVERARASREWSEGYIPHPTTWLNQGRWEDEPAEVIPLQPRKAHDRHHHDRSPTPREDRLGRMLRGAMAAVDERKSELG